MYVDVHSHLFDKWIGEDVASVVLEAQKAGVSAIIENGVNHETNLQVLELSKKFSVIRPALGIYPSELTEDLDSEIEFIRSYANKIAAVGEVGLDGSYPEMDRQKEIFSAMIDLAKELDKPISVHSRKAESEVTDFLISKGAKKVHMHCFMGDLETLKKGINAGFYYSITCIVMINPLVQEIAKLVPTKQILTETDSPYLHWEKGARNEPKNVVESVKKIASLKGLEEEEMKKIIFMNYKKLFE